MKKIMMILVAVAMCAIATLGFNSCKQNEPEKEYTYQLTFGGIQDFSYPDGMEVIDWYHAIKAVYAAELGVNPDDEYFTRKGDKKTCNQQVYDACVRAEETVKKTFYGGKIQIIALNVTTKMEVYSQWVP